MKITRSLISFAWIALVAASGLAQVSEASLKGITDTVTVRRDSRSIPYIEATNDRDAYFVQGYVTASDRLWQMDLLRRVARGETAEIFGAPALEEDKRWRRYGFAAIAEDSLQYLSPELRAALESYAKGVNAYIETLDDTTLPIEFRVLQYKPRPWTPADSVVIGKILADALSTTWRNDLMRASIAGLPAAKRLDLTNRMTPYDVVLFGKDDKPSVVADVNQISVGPDILEAATALAGIRESSLSRIGFYAEELAASNNWVISGKRTSGGKPILANDPHLLPSAPGIWYLTHLATPTMRVSGVTFPGTPGIVLGHNEHIAWGATNVGPDVQDLYQEDISAVDPGGVESYATPTGPRRVEKRKELILVRKSLVSTEKTVTPFEVESTRHGPIIMREGGKAYSLKWTAFDPKNSEFEAFYFLNRAQNWNDFKTSLATYGGPMQNFVYADVTGNIGWYAAGRVPLRKTSDGSVPYDGSTDAGEWIGYIPFAELPNLYNPKEGFIVTANQRIVGTSYKYVSHVSRDAASPWRARRIYDLLSRNPKVTIDAVSEVQHDSYNIPLASLAKEIVKQNAASAATLELFKAWDGRMSPDSKAAVVVNEIRVCLANKMADENKPAPASAIRERVLDWAVRDQTPRWLPKQFANYSSFMMACEGEARASLADPKRLGPDESKWTWGSMSRSRFPHPLASAPLIGGQFMTPSVPIFGSGQTPNVASFVSMRHIASPGMWDQTRHVIPLGQSGNPQSPFYKDQFEAWRTGTPAVFPFTKGAVEEAAKVVTRFAPAR